MANSEGKEQGIAREYFVALEQFLAITAKYPHCVANPERLGEALDNESFAIEEPWRRDLLLELCRQGFAPQLRLHKNAVAKRCIKACESLVDSEDCTLEQALWAVMAWRVVASAGGKAMPTEVPADNSCMERSASSSSAPNASKRASRSAWAYCQVGDTFVFGNYPQDANGGSKSIEWQVLRRDNDGLLVISKYALDCKKYNEDYCDITWSQCTLRKWLNSEFINKAFDATERKQIKKVHLPNPTSHWNNVPGGPDTDDQVFLLSHDEAESLFADDDHRLCKPTEYAVANNAWVDEDSGACHGTCFWWLRSPGFSTTNAASVNPGGGFYGIGVSRNCDAVRPAFKIAL